MLKRGWMLRYLPPIVTENIPEYVTFAGYAWAALCFLLAAGTIGVAMGSLWGRAAGNVSGHAREFAWFHI